jgi:hypothetical protein
VAKITKRGNGGIGLNLNPLKDDEQNPEVKIESIPKAEGFRFHYSNEPNEEEFLQSIKSFLDSYGFDKDGYAGLEKKDIGINELFRFNPDQTIKFTKYLGSNVKGRAEIKKILVTKGDKLICAPLGSGKTQAIVREAHKINHKVLYAVPLIFNVEQFSKKYKFADKIDNHTKPSVGKNKLRDKNVVFCTYDTADRIIRTMLRKDTKNYTLVIDEAHNLVCQSLFRDQALRKLRENRKKFNKVIYITGTPEVLIPVLKKESPELKVIEFSRKKFTYNKGSYNLIALSKCNPHRYILEQLSKKPVKGITIIVEEDIHNLEVLSDLLIAYGLARQDEICFMSSNQKYTKVYGDIVILEKLPDNIKFLLSTSVISDGANLNNTNINAFYSINWFDLIKLRQMQSRLRKANKQLKYYDVIVNEGATDDQSETAIRDIQHHFALSCEQREFTNEIYKRILSSDIKLKKFESFHKDKTIYKLNNKFVNDNYALLQQLLVKDLYVNLKSNPANRIAYIKIFFNFDPELINMDQIEYNYVEEDYEVYKSKIKDRAKQKLVTLFTEFENNHTKVFSSYNQLKKEFSKGTKANLKKEDEIYKVLDFELCGKVTDELKELMDVGYPKAICIKSFTNNLDALVDLVNIKNTFKSDRNQRKSISLNLADTTGTEKLLIFKLYSDLVNNRQNHYPNNDSKIIVDAIKANLRKNVNKVVPKEIHQELEPTLGYKPSIKKYLDYIFVNHPGEGHRSYNHIIERQLTISEILSSINMQPTDEELNSLVQLGLPV